MNSAWNADDEKDMNDLAKQTLKGQSVVSDAAVKNDLIKIKEAQAAPALDKTTLLLTKE